MSQHNVLDDEPHTGSLRGLRVIELGHIIAGPFCGRLFADHGADVIKVEPPGRGDPLRGWGGQYRGIGLHWPLMGRGKRSVTLDLHREAGRRALLALVASADVVIENFRPGTLERWGLGWEELRRANPKLILARVSGFGQTGPYRDRAGFGSIGEAMSGFRYLCGEPGRPPVRAGISLGDSLAGVYAFVGCLLALRARDGGSGVAGTGQGQVVDVALYEALWSHMESLIAEHEKLGVVRQPTGAVLPGIAPSNVYSTADGQWIVIGANQDSVFERLAMVMDRPEWVAAGSPYSAHAGRGESQSELDGCIEAWTSAHDADVLLARLVEAGVPAGRIYTASDIATDPHFRARDMILQVSEPSLDGERVAMPGVVPKLSTTPGEVARGAPLLGEHTVEVLEVVLGKEQLAALLEAGAV